MSVKLGQRESLWRRFRHFLLRLLATDDELSTQRNGETAGLGTSGSSSSNPDPKNVERARVVVGRQLEEEFQRNLREPVRGNRACA
jgi:hypothetical protein